MDVRIGENYFKLENEGIFIGLLKLLCDENEMLREHLLKSQKQGQNYGHITFLSNYFINKVLLVTRRLLVQKLVEEILRNGEMYGVEMDLSQDITTIEQCSIVLRYIDDVSVIAERTAVFGECESTNGAFLYNFLEKSLNDIGLNAENIGGFSFDGAGNMSSEEKGVNYYVKKKNPKSVFSWCFAHRLNLCAKAALSSAKAKYVLGVCENTAVFIKQSHIRMNLWTKVVQELPDFSSKIKLKIIGQTRWTSSYEVVHHIVKTEVHLFAVIKTFVKICNLDDITLKALSSACLILNEWLNCENIITAVVLDKIFGIVTTTTKKLQASGLHMLQAMQYILDLYNKLLDLRSDYQSLLHEAKDFVEILNYLLSTDEYIISMK